MNIIEVMKSMVEAKDLGNIIRAYGDERYHDVNPTTHLDAWAKNKEHIFKLFGNNLKIEREVEAALPPSLIRKKLEEFIDSDLSERKYTLVKLFLKGLGAEEIQENVLRRDFTLFDTTFKKGIKISKCFKALTKKEFVNDITVKYSMFLQSLKAKGIAVLSIDPKDYLTMSANSSGWRSCHAPDGEYRVGTVAYMMDTATVISYIKSTDDCEIDGGTIHTNKIWRQIVLINSDNDFALQARQYPNTNDANAHTIGEMLKTVFGAAKEIEYKQEQAKVGDNDYRYLQESHDGDRLYYNDIACEAFDYGYVVYPANTNLCQLRTDVDNGIYKRAIVGHDVTCLCGCGSSLYDAENFFRENSGYYDEYNYDYDEE